MSYIQYDKNGNIITPEDLQNKTLWCKDGEKIEYAFVNKYGKDLELNINPVKTTNPYAPDLINNFGLIADLKTQNTPFFKAHKLFGLDPSYTVVFNRKDYERYEQLYPEIDIYFWIEWHSVKFQMGNFIQTVDYVNGVWKISFNDLKSLIEKAPEHFYQQRKYDNIGNAKSSFVLNINNPLFKKLI